MMAIRFVVLTLLVLLRRVVGDAAAREIGGRGSDNFPRLDPPITG